MFLSTLLHAVALAALINFDLPPTLCSVYLELGFKCTMGDLFVIVISTFSAQYEETPICYLMYRLLEIFADFLLLTFGCN